MNEPHWPTLPRSPSPPGEHRAEPGVREYTLLVEQTTGSDQSLLWMGAPVTQQTWQDRTEVRRQAEHLAWHYSPGQSVNEQRRSVYRMSADQYLTIVEGGTTTCWFRTIVAEPLGWRTARRQAAPH